MATVHAHKVSAGDLLMLRKGDVWEPAIGSNTQGNAFVVNASTGLPRMESIREYDEIKEAAMIDVEALAALRHGASS